MTLSLTRARQRGLEVLAIDGRARESNSTVITDHQRRRCVYWQTSQWLVEAGLADRIPVTCDIVITPLGRHELAKVIDARGLQLLLPESTEAAKVLGHATSDR